MQDLHQTLGEGEEDFGEIYKKNLRAEMFFNIWKRLASAMSASKVQKS